MSQVTSIGSGGGGGGSITIAGDTGGPLSGPNFTLTGASTGLTFAGTGSGTETLTGTLNVTNGGTGKTSVIAYAPIVGGSSSTGAFQSASTGLSTSGFILTSNGSSSVPSFQSVSASGAVTTIDGDSGSATPTSGVITVSGGSTGLTTSASGSTVDLTGTLIVSNGGTGRATLTNHGVLIGAGTSAITQSAVGTNGQVFIGASAADPGWVTPTVGTGLSLTTNSTTLQYGLTIPVVVSSGGTGLTSTTAYSVLCGGTTSTAALQNVSGVGTSGQVLTSNGASALPTWQTAAGGVSGPGSSTTRDIATWNGSSGNALFDNPGVTISSSGYLQNTNQPAFQVYQSTNGSNVTGDGTNYQLALDTKVFDQSSSYNTSTFTFTAPVTGRYYFEVAVIYTNIVAQTTVQLQITTTGNTFNLSYNSGIGVVAAGGFLGSNGSAFAAMTAADTCTFNVIASGSTKTVNVDGNQGLTYAGGFLVC